jgi:hypothetical protein
MSMKNSNDTIGNRTCGLPTCSAVPQPTALLRASHLVYITVKIITGQNRNVLIGVASRRMTSLLGAIAIALI